VFIDLAALRPPSYALDIKEITTYRLRRDSLDWELVGEELVVADVERSRLLGVNATGTTLWQQLEAGASRQALVGGLIESFGVSEQVAAADVDDFLDELRKRDLLEEH
jgi:hypothetical protein